MTTTFDLFEYGRKLEKAGFTPEQVEIQVEGMRAQSLAFQSSFKDFDQAKHQETASKGDLRETELRLQKEIREVEMRLQKEIREVEMRLQENIRLSEIRLLKWQWGVGLALCVIMAKGFGWLGF